MSLSPSKNLLAIAGSLRRGSYNRALLQAALECAPPGLTFELYDGLSRIPLFDEDLERETEGGPAEVQRLRAMVAAADGLLIATPEYNQSLPGVLKNAIDWLSRPAPAEVLAAKPVAVIGATGGRWGTRLAQAALRQVLSATESRVLPHPSLFLAEAGRVFDGEGGLVDPAVRERLTELLTAFGRWIDLLGEPQSGSTPG
jgi:chromate reductase